MKYYKYRLAVHCIAVLIYSVELYDKFIFIKKDSFKEKSSTLYHVLTVKQDTLLGGIEICPPNDTNTTTNKRLLRRVTMLLPIRSMVNIYITSSLPQKEYFPMFSFVITQSYVHVLHTHRQSRQ
ncbi:MAG TPA: hypothetical protein VFJ51_10975 [Nitrososphaeraceae archaeon]|nr:hypothetical protein [Nitrososphaeraceae archaeon]